jgi:hypothetical protein
VKPSLGVDPRKVYFVTGLSGQLLEILQLRAAVTFAKGVNVVHVAHNHPSGLGERVAT